jgi:hypothetical protein
MLREKLAAADNLRRRRQYAWAQNAKMNGLTLTTLPPFPPILPGFFVPPRYRYEESARGCGVLANFSHLSEAIL